MYFFDDGGFCEHEIFVAAFGSLPAIILRSQLIALYIGAHGSIVDQDSMGKGVEKLAHKFPSNPPWDTHYSARAVINSRQKSGMSATTRPHTIFPSRNAPSLPQMPTTLVISSFMPVHP